MALIKVSVYRKKYFEPGSQPAINTIKKWIDSGKIAGKKIGSMYFVDPDKEQNEITPVNHLAAKVLQRSI